VNRYRCLSSASWRKGCGVKIAGSYGTCRTTRWCNAGTEWDGPTRLGSPDGTGGF
jgi:hypothetical protein